MQPEMKRIEKDWFIELIPFRNGANYTPAWWSGCLLGLPHRSWIKQPGSIAKRFPLEVSDYKNQKPSNCCNIHHKPGLILVNLSEAYSTLVNLYT